MLWRSIIKHFEEQFFGIFHSISITRRRLLYVLDFEVFCVFWKWEEKKQLVINHHLGNKTVTTTTFIKSMPSRFFKFYEHGLNIVIINQMSNMPLSYVPQKKKLISSTVRAWRERWGADKINIKAKKKKWKVNLKCSLTKRRWRQKIIRYVYWTPTTADDDC